MHDNLYENNVEDVEMVTDAGKLTSLFLQDLINSISIRRNKSKECFIVLGGSIKFSFKNHLGCFGGIDLKFGAPQKRNIGISTNNQVKIIILVTLKKLYHGRPPMLKATLDETLG